MLRLRVRSAPGVRGRQLHLLGRQGQEEEEGEEITGKKLFMLENVRKNFKNVSQAVIFRMTFAY